MADIATITQAKLTQEAFARVLGVKPSLDIREDHVRVYYPPDRLKQAQNAFKLMMEKPPGKLRTDIGPVITPYFVKKGLPFLMGISAGAYFLGKS